MHSHIRRRSMMLATKALGCPRIARAQEFPSRPIKLLVPFAAGGPMDLGPQVIVENRIRAAQVPLN